MRVCVSQCVRARAIVLGVEWKISTCWQRSNCSSPSALAALHWTPAGGGGAEGGGDGEGWLWGGARAPFLTFALLCDCTKINFATLPTAAPDVKTSRCCPKPEQKVGEERKEKEWQQSRRVAIEKEC